VITLLERKKVTTSTMPLEFMNRLSDTASSRGISKYMDGTMTPTSLPNHQRNTTNSSLPQCSIHTSVFGPVMA
jgi:hypothetical protein